MATRPFFRDRGADVLFRQQAHKEAVAYVSPDRRVARATLSRMGTRATVGDDESGRRSSPATSRRNLTRVATKPIRGMMRRGRADYLSGSYGGIAHLGRRGSELDIDMLHARAGTELISNAGWPIIRCC